MIHLFSAWGRGYQPLADLTWPCKVAYAKRWGYTASHGIHENAFDPNLQCKDVSWDRVSKWLAFLASIPEGDWLWFTGCDVAITNPDIDIVQYCDDAFDLIGANDVAELQTDSTLWKSNQRTRDFLALVLATASSGIFRNDQEAINTILSGHSLYGDFTHEMGTDYATQAMQERLQLALNRTPVRVKIVSQKAFNCYDRRALPASPFPGFPFWPPTDGSQWMPGDFVFHLCAQTFEYRMKHMPEYIKCDQ